MNGNVNAKAPQAVAAAYEAIREVEGAMRSLAADVWQVEKALPADRRCKRWRPRKAVIEAAGILDAARLGMRDRAVALHRVRRALDKAEWVQPSVQEQVVAPAAPLPPPLAKGSNGHATEQQRLF